MQFELWGVTLLPYLQPPERFIGYVLLAIYGLITCFLIIHKREDFRQLSGRQWAGTILLALLSILAGQLFPITLSSESQLPPLLSAQNPEAVVAPFAFVPFLFAGAVLNPLAALLVGFAGGLGRALWQTHQITDPFQFALAAILAAQLMQQNYSGRLYGLMRLPVVSAIFAALLLVPLTGLSTAAYADARATLLEVLDLALSTSYAYLVPVLAQALLGGMVVIALLSSAPQLQRRPKFVPSPLNQSLNTRLVTTFFVFAGLLSLVLIIVGFNLAFRISRDLAVHQMVRDAQSVSVKIPDFRARYQNLLQQASSDPALLANGDENQDALLRKLFQRGDFFRSLILATDNDVVIANFPHDDYSSRLTNLERKSVADALQTTAPFISPAQPADDATYVISFVVPVLDSKDNSQLVMIGRMPAILLDELVVGLQGTLGKGTGIIIDELGQIIGHPDQVNLLGSWRAPDDALKVIETGDSVPGSAYMGVQSNTNTRQLVYYQTGPDHPWTIVITVPYEVILGQALQISAQLAMVLVTALVLFGIFLLLLGRSITGPLTQLVHASQQMAGGSLTTPITPQGDDEIGRLGLAFNQMQTALKRQFDELSLLLAISQDVSRSIDINQGMPSILRGALRGTGAAGVRVVVLNPSGRQPLAFGEGPASQTMAAFDRQVMSLIRQKPELVLADAPAVNGALVNGSVPDKNPRSLVALPLATHNRFQGVFWLTYRQAHQFDQNELNFLRMLSSQASVLVENARLYATAEGGRRRLAAVLASTSDAVIVTDPTERILLINPAMERSFNLEAMETIGRPVGMVIKSEPLIKALSKDSERTRNLEVPTVEGKVLYANASTIFNNEGQAIGRVAVLHDITQLKELDAMKSEFVATVSHDLRSPLTFMIGYASMLSMVGELEPKQQEYVDKILGGIDQMSKLIDDLLGLGRLEAGVELVSSHFRLEDIIESVVEEFRQPARGKGIALVIDLAGNLPRVEGDAALIRQAVANLTGNAIKYAPESERIILSAVVNDGEAIIAVRDFGPGISKKDQIRLFEKFYRVSQPGTDRVKGSGLGLALVKSIIQRHGGRTWVESQPGAGSTFYIALPLAPDLN